MAETSIKNMTGNLQYGGSADDEPSEQKLNGGFSATARKDSKEDNAEKEGSETSESGQRNNAAALEATKDNEAADNLIGVRVAKYFDTELFLGGVVEVDSAEDSDDEEEKLFHVLYDDGDEEDFDSEQLDEARKLFRQYELGKIPKNRPEQESCDETENELDGLSDATDDESANSQSFSDQRRERKRRRLDRRAAAAKFNSSLSDAESEDTSSRPTKKPKAKRRKKKIMSESIEARKEQADERERARERKQWRLSSGSAAAATTASDDEVTSNGNRIVLNEVRPASEAEVTIAHKLGSQLKEHQVEGVRFLWQSLIHSIEAAADSNKAKGAILAHSMGLGKSLQVVTFLHTVLLAKPLSSLGVGNAIILGPKNTLYNWRDEFQKWDADDDLDIHMVDPAVHKSIRERLKVVKRWHDTSSEKRPSVLLISYDQFKMLVSGRPKAAQRQELKKRLLDPGPDIVVLDEGHVIANSKTAINNAVMAFKTKRRLILTGTPLSNNLLEYHSMVSFVHRNLLSSSVAEFRDRFCNPIEAGQYLDASDHEVRQMKRRVHVLNRKLNPVIHRKGYDILEKSLPKKYEYIISVRLNDVQKKLYKAFLDRRENGAEEDSFFHAWHSLQRIWNHPRAIEHAAEQRKENEKRATLKREMSDFIDDGSEKSSCCDLGDNYSSMDEKSWHGSDSEAEEDEEPTARESPIAKKQPDGNDSNTASSEEVSWHGGDSELEPDHEVIKQKVAAKSNGLEERGNHTEKPEARNQQDDGDEWWKAELSDIWPDDLATESGKFQALKEIVLNQRPGDKLGIFSQSLVVLDLIEEWFLHNGGFRAGDDDDEEDEFEFCKGVDLLRIDGSTSSEKRQRFCNKINDFEDPARVILVSVKAGALGINLVGVNRVVLFDTSFNPTHDVQAIFRAYRYGQTRPVSIYRLIAAGSLEERIYRRQVEKRALFSRVVDELTIERHFARVDVDEMVRLLEDEDLEADARKSKIHYKSHLDAPPADLLFAQVLKADGGRRLPLYHEHDSLLENKEDEELSEQEKKDAWAEFERAIENEKAMAAGQSHHATGAAPQAVPSTIRASAVGTTPFYHGQQQYPQYIHPSQPSTAHLAPFYHGQQQYQAYIHPPQQYHGQQQYQQYIHPPQPSTAHFAPFYHGQQQYQLYVQPPQPPIAHSSDVEQYDGEAH